MTNMFFCLEIPFLRILTELRLTSQLSSKTAIATRSPAKDSPPGLQIEARTQSTVTVTTNQVNRLNSRPYYPVEAQAPPSATDFRERASHRK